MRVKVMLLIFIVATVLVLLKMGSLSPMKETVMEFFMSPPPPVTSVVVKSDGSRTTVFLITDDKHTQLSDGANNVSQPLLRGDFIVWVEAPIDRAEKYIVRYHRPTQTRLNITTQGVSDKPKVSTQGKVVWQQWQDERWQIMYFDGNETKPITESPFSAVSPDIAGKYIVYAQQQADGTWSVERHDLQTGKTERVREPSNDAEPYFNGEELIVKK